jgi:pimeloyl-ACP methyl ester carboxylesterase
MAKHIPNSQLIIFPDSGHGSAYQYPALFVVSVARFLDSGEAFG